MNATESVTLTRIVRAAFPAQKFDEFTVDVWADALRDADFGECREAVRRLVSKQTFASVAEILAEARLTRREAYRRLSDAKTFREIEGAREAHDRNQSHAAYLEARRAFDEALAAKRGDDEQDGAE